MTGSQNPQPLTANTWRMSLRGAAASNRQVTSTICASGSRWIPISGRRRTARTSVLTRRTQAPSPCNAWQNISTCPLSSPARGGNGPTTQTRLP